MPMSDLSAFALIGNIRDRIIEFGQECFHSQEQLDALLTYCGLPASNGVLYSLGDLAPRAPEIPRVRVYVLGHRTGDVTLTKVGVSQDPELRCRNLGRERCSELFVYRVSDAFTRVEAMRIERLAHAALAEARVVGEWFSCGPQLAWQAVANVGGFDPGDVV